MDKKYDVTALGEILIDFTPCGKSEAGQRLFEQNPGGAPANVLTALSKFHRKTAFIGKVGLDMHGSFLKAVLIENGISALRINPGNIGSKEKVIAVVEAAKADLQSGAIVVSTTSADCPMFELQ